MGSTADDVRRIALTLPHSIQDGDEIRYLVEGGKAFAWTRSTTTSSASC